MDSIAVKKIHRAPFALAEALGECGAATVHEAQGRIGYMRPYMRPIYAGARIGGTAVTVLAEPGDNWMIHVALEFCQKGDILVVACTTENDDGFFGDLLGTSAQAQGVQGLIIDAGVRDTATLREMKFPVWSKAVSSRGTVKNTPGSVNVPVVCAGQLVHPGDVIVADDDGVTIVARKQAGRILELSRQREADEEKTRARLAKGELTLDIFSMRDRLKAAGLRYIDHIDDLD